MLKLASIKGDLNEIDQGPVTFTAVIESAAPDSLPVLPKKSVAPTVGESTAQRRAAGSVASGGGSQQDAVRRTSHGGTGGSPFEGGYAQVSVFGVQGKGSKFVYLFDRSSSMEGAPLAAAKRELIASLQSLESVHQFHIIFFNNKTHGFNLAGGGRRVAFGTDRNKQLAANFVRGITADGGTDRLIALRAAIAFSPDIIFFLTDADDPMTPRELADIAKANRRAEASICVIEFGRRQAPLPGNFLAELAQQSGGQYGYVNTTLLTRPPENKPR